MILEEITMKEFDKKVKKTKTVILPLGALEAHGPHLPLGTDTIGVYEAAKKAAKKIDVFVAPPLYYGVCRSTRKHPGTVGISGDTLRSLIRDVVKGLHANRLNNFILVSGHASTVHLSSLQEAGESILEELPSPVKVAIVSAYDVFRQAAGALCKTENDSHAGEIETSLILHLKPQLVQGKGEEEYPHFPHPILTRNKRKYWKNSVWGDPTKGSVAKGRVLSRALIDYLVELVKKIEKFKE